MLVRLVPSQSDIFHQECAELKQPTATLLFPNVIEAATLNPILKYELPKDDRARFVSHILELQERMRVNALGILHRPDDNAELEASEEEAPSISADLPVLRLGPLHSGVQRRLNQLRTYAPKPEEVVHFDPAEKPHNLTQEAFVLGQMAVALTEFFETEEYQYALTFAHQLKETN